MDSYLHLNFSLSNFICLTNSNKSKYINKKLVFSLVTTFVITLFVFFSDSNLLFAQKKEVIDLPINKRTSYEGRHFWIGFMQNEVQQIQSGKPVQLKLFLAATKQSSVKIIMPDGTELNNLVPDNGVSIRDIWSNYESRNSEVVERKGIEIIATEPITVYGYSSQFTTSDLYTAIPSAQLGLEYRIVTMPNDYYTPPSGKTNADLDPFELANRPGMFMVIAQENGTYVEINTSAPTEKDRVPKSSFFVTLNRGETYLVKSKPTPGINGTNDLTGSLVKSNKPVAVLSGHSRTASPQVQFSKDDDSKNHLIEMLPPITTWGKEYYTAPFGGTANILGSMYKIVAKEANTVVTASTRNGGVTSYTLVNAGDFVEVKDVNEGAYWESTKQFLLTEFTSREGTINPRYNYFDPAFSVVTPANQYINSMLFRTPKNNISDFNDSFGNPADQYSWHRCIIICEDAAIEDLSINGGLVSNLSNTFYTIGFQSTGYSYVIIELTQNTTYKINSNKGKFSGIMFGGGAYDAYANPLGSLLSNVNITDDTPPEIASTEDCGNVIGNITDNIPTDRGIESLTVMPETKNFTWTIDPIRDTSKLVNFKANPIDRGKDGIFAFEFRDKEGQGKLFRYEYTGIKITQIPYYDIGTMYFPEKKCFDYKIKNESSGTITLNSLSDVTALGIDVTLPIKLPYTFKANEEITIKVCVKSSDLIIDFLERIEFTYECDYKTTLLIAANFKLPNLRPENHDFGLVRVGDTVCTDIFWINKGDVDITAPNLTFLGFEDNWGKTILIDTVGLFPVEIKIGDTLFIKNVCFTPDSVGDYVFNFRLNNNFNIDNVLRVTGSGGAPKIQVVNLDWGKRRLGTFNDTTIIIQNTGNYRGRIEEVVINKTRDDSNTENIINALKGKTFEPNESLTLNFNFIPQNEDFAGYLYINKLTVDWRFHEMITFEIEGEATLPQIQTRLIDMGKCIVNGNTQGRDSLMFEVSGSEDLTISDIEPISGDIDAFELSTNFNQTGKFNIGYQRLIDINFKPTRVGAHFLKIGVRNDALPNFAFKVDTVTIIGFAVPGDTIGLEVSFENKVVNTCDSTNLTATVINTSNKDLLIKDIALNSPNFDSWFVNLPNKSFTIKSKEDFKLDLGVILERGQEGEIELNISCQYQVLIDAVYIDRDTLITLKHYIKPITQTLVVDEIKNLLYSIGDTASLQVKGSFPYDIDKDLELTMNLKVQIYDFVLKNKEIDLIITSDEGQIKIPVSLTQTKNEILIDIKIKDIFIGANAKWEINFLFTKMLNEDLNPNFSFEITGKKCFEPIIYNFSAKIEEICVFNLRSIELFANLMFIKVVPNPISYFLNVDFAIPNDEEIVKFNIFSTNGEKICEFEKFNLKKGRQSIIFEVRDLPSTNYILLLETSQFVQHTLFTVYK